MSLRQVQLHAQVPQDHIQIPLVASDQLRDAVIQRTVLQGILQGLPLMGG